MIFQVKRTSSLFIESTDLEKIQKDAEGNLPCEGASIHVFRVNDDEPTYYDSYFTINIDTLEELIEWRKKLGVQIIINPNGNNGIDGLNCIEIYDDYRE